MPILSFRLSNHIPNWYSVSLYEFVICAFKLFLFFFITKNIFYEYIYSNCICFKTNAQTRNQIETSCSLEMQIFISNHLPIIILLHPIPFHPNPSRIVSCCNNTLHTNVHVCVCVCVCLCEQRSRRCLPIILLLVMFILSFTWILKIIINSMLLLLLLVFCFVLFYFICWCWCSCCMNIKHNHFISYHLKLKYASRLVFFCILCVRVFVLFVCLFVEKNANYIIYMVEMIWLANIVWLNEFVCVCLNRNQSRQLTEKTLALKAFCNQ